MFRSATGVVTIGAAHDPRSRLRRPIRSGPVPWMLPAIVVLGLFYLYPVFDVLRLSFTDATLIGDHENYTFASIVNAIGSPRLRACCSPRSSSSAEASSDSRSSA